MLFHEQFVHDFKMSVWFVICRKYPAQPIHHILKNAIPKFWFLSRNLAEWAIMLRPRTKCQSTWYTVHLPLIYLYLHLIICKRNTDSIPFQCNIADTQAKVMLIGHIQCGQRLCKIRRIKIHTWLELHSVKKRNCSNVVQGNHNDELW